LIQRTNLSTNAFKLRERSGRWKRKDQPQIIILSVRLTIADKADSWRLSVCWEALMKWSLLRCVIFLMSNNELIVGTPVLSRVGDLYQVAGRIRGEGIDEEIWFRSATPFAPVGMLATEAFLSFGLFLAMRDRLALRVEGAVSEKLMEGLVKYQKILSEWYPDYRPTEVEAGSVLAELDVEPGAGTAFFFSGGVDSFHTYLGNREDLTHALFLYGADIKLHETAYRELTSRELNTAAREMGVEFIEVESNLLEFTEEHCSWAYHSHGAYLPAIAKLFGDRFHKVSLASSYPEHKLVPWGSHPSTDPLWSGAGMEVVHFGGMATRFDKVSTVGKNELARRFVRVCWENVEGSYNCCECEKCLRTMVALRIAGVLDDCPVFPRKLDLDAVSKVRYSSIGNRADWHWNILALRYVDDPELEAVLAQQLAGSDAAGAVKEFSRYHKAMFTSPEWARLLPKVRNKIFKNLKRHDAEWFSHVLEAGVQMNSKLAFDVLWKLKRKWMKRRLREAESERRLARLKSGLQRLGIGKKD
jgi:hypothetical protein